MTKTNVASDSMSSRLIENIKFHASLMALHAAIASSGTELKKRVQEFGVGRCSDGPLHSLVELVRRPPKGAEPLVRPDPQPFE